MTYCIVNYVEHSSEYTYEQFMCIGIPDERTAKVILKAFIPYEKYWNTFKIEEDPYKLKGSV